MTLNRIEKGDPSTSLGNYATVLFWLGMIDRQADIADARHDAVGLELAAERLPQRIRLERRKPSTGRADDGQGVFVFRQGRTW
jgi:hypothetical protein